MESLVFVYSSPQPPELQRVARVMSSTSVTALFIAAKL